MSNFIRNFRLDQLSFWIGFITGTIFLWVLGRLWPIVIAGISTFRTWMGNVQRDITTGTETRFRSDTLRHVQSLHLANQICSLDEIIVPPKIYCFTEQKSHNDEELIDFETAEEIIPFIPDFPEIGTAFANRTFSLGSILRQGARIVLMAPSGAGKTTTLCHLATQLSRQEIELEELSEYLPIFIDVYDLELNIDEAGSVFDSIYAAVSKYASTVTQTRLPNILKDCLTQGRAVLLIDGADELPPDSLEPLVNWVNRLIIEYPKNLFTISASINNAKAFFPYEFQPVGLLYWRDTEKQSFIKNWKLVWAELQLAQTSNPFSSTNPLILESWMQQSAYDETPFAFTLRAWSYFAGDGLGPDEISSLEAYVRRSLQGNTGSRSVLSSIAKQLIWEQKPDLNRRDLAKLIPEFSSSSNIGPVDSSEEIRPPIEDQSFISPSTKMINEMIQAGILTESLSSKLRFSHINLMTYFASEHFLDDAALSNLFTSWEWEGRQNTIAFIAGQIEIADFILPILNTSDEPLSRNLLTVGSWLRFANQSYSWTQPTLRALVEKIQDIHTPLSLRVRICAILANNPTKGTDILFRRYLEHMEPSIRYLGCLGVGLIRDIKSIKHLGDLIDDPDPQVRKAACLALGAVGERQSMDIISLYLLQGDEALQKCAAEMLATDQDLGYETLKEGSQFDDILVRRAIVSGLKKVNKKWSLDLLATMQLEDSQWVVRNAAEHALQEPHYYMNIFPKPFSELQNSPWLIEFASEQGRGIASNQAAQEVLLDAAKNGNKLQKKLGFYRLMFIKEIPIGGYPILYEAIYGTDEELRELAYLVLWLSSDSQTKYPHPAEFGYQ